MHNVYKSSPKIRIRWLSEDATDPSIFCMDFCDSTDIDCVLTSVTLAKSLKAKYYELVKEERSRIESILKKALDVEKGIVARPEVTEENPDGCEWTMRAQMYLCVVCDTVGLVGVNLCHFLDDFLPVDLSLYKDESQIEKKSKRKSSEGEGSSKKTESSGSKKRKAADDGDDDDDDDDFLETPRKKSKASAKSSAKRKSVAKATSAKVSLDIQHLGRPHMQRPIYPFHSSKSTFTFSLK